MSGVYQLRESPLTGVVRLSDNAIIPEADGNRDWVTYQEWLAEPNTPDEAPTPDPPTVISALDFFNRFTDLEKVAVQTACNANATLGVGLTHGIAAGWINLLDMVVDTWMDGLVSDEAISGERKTEIITP